jgi:hypothetical protein
MGMNTGRLTRLVEETLAEANNKIELYSILPFYYNNKMEFYKNNKDVEIYIVQNKKSFEVWSITKSGTKSKEGTYDTRKEAEKEADTFI